jgi:hypothetical protein
MRKIWFQAEVRVGDLDDLPEDLHDTGRLTEGIGLAGTFECGLDFVVTLVSELLVDCGLLNFLGQILD